MREMTLSRANLREYPQSFAMLDFVFDIQVHKAPVPEPIDDPLPGEHPVPQEDPVPSPNPEVEDARS